MLYRLSYMALSGCPWPRTRYAEAPVLQTGERPVAHDTQGAGEGAFIWPVSSVYSPHKTRHVSASKGHTFSSDEPQQGIEPQPRPYQGRVLTR
jgi:hypothetical protein